MRALVLAALATAMLAAPALAQDSGTYVNFGYTHIDDDDISNGTLTGRFGRTLNPNFAVEAEAGIGVVDDTVLGVDVNTDFTLGGFALARVPVGETLNLHGRIGYQHTWATAEAAGIEVEEDGGSFAVGAGGQVDLTERSGIRADYTRLTDDETNHYAISYVLKF